MRKILFLVVLCGIFICGKAQDRKKSGKNPPPKDSSSLKTKKTIDSLNHNIDSLKNFISLAQKADSIKQRQADSVKQRQVDSIIQHKVDSIIQSKADSNRQRQKLWIALNYSPQSAFSRLLIDEASFGSQENLDYRLQQMRAIYGYNAGVALGWWLNHSNRIYLSISYQQMGFESKSSAVDWETGHLQEDVTSSLYHFKFIQTGFGYSYVHNKRKTVNVVLDMGITVNWKDKFYQKENEIPPSIDFKNPIIMGNLGIGANFNISKYLDLELVPTVSYSFTPIHTGDLKTYLHNIGITCRLGFNFFNKKDTGK